VSTEALKAPIGAVCLEVIVAYIIAFTDQNPQFWKLSLSGVLLVVLSTTPEFRKLWRQQVRRHHNLRNGIGISSLDFHYGHSMGEGIFFLK